MAITEWKLYRDRIGQGSVNILLCDDDPAFLEELQSQLRRIFDKMNQRAAVTVCHSPAELAPQRLADCDLAFFDIDFDQEEQNGMDLARALRQVNSRALLFFVTNYIDYAPAGYEVQAFRYILKRDMDQVLERYVLEAMELLAEDRAYLQLRDREQTQELLLGQITYIEVLDHYVSIHGQQGVYTLGATLSGLERALEGHGFLRIHKSYLVNMAHIRRFRSRECLLSDGTALAVSEKNYAQQKQKYLIWKGLK